VIHRRGPWHNFEAVEYVTLEWIDWFNHRRLLEPIGNIPPAEAEEQCYAMTEQQPMAASLEPNNLRRIRRSSSCGPVCNGAFHNCCQVVICNEIKNTFGIIYP
jgi:hypothetical protein